MSELMTTTSDNIAKWHERQIVAWAKNNTKIITLDDGSTINFYWSDGLGWVTIPEDDDE